MSHRVDRVTLKQLFDDAVASWGAPPQVAVAKPSAIAETLFGAVLLAAGVALGIATDDRPHPALCPCPNCNPRSVSWMARPMPDDEAAVVLRTYGGQGHSLALGRHRYASRVDLTAADRAQNTLADIGLDSARRRFVDWLYQDLTAHNSALAAIPLTDARARHWVVAGALSGVEPAGIRDFVECYRTR